MGCGASSGGPKYVTPEQCKEICADCCTRMEVLCAHTAFQKPEDFKMVAPPEVLEMKKCSANLYKNAQDTMAESDKAAEESKAGGGVLGAIKGTLQQAGGQVVGGGLLASAQLLDGLTKDLEKPFEEIGKELLQDKDTKEKLYKILIAHINAFKFADPDKIARGEKPLDGSTYAGVKGDIISTTLHTLSKKALFDLLKEPVAEAIKNKTVTSTWKKAEDAYGTAYDLIKKVVSEEKLNEGGIKPIKCDINTDITNAFIEALGKKMGETEIATRKAPADKDISKPGKPASFAVVFSNSPLHDKVYQSWQTEAAP